MAENEWVTGRVTLRIGEVPLDLEMTVPAAPVKPHRMLPIFHQMANSFAQIGVDAAEANNIAVSCKAKCSACCHQAVPVSEAELYYIAELVNSMPEPRRSEVRSRFESAVEHFRSSGWFDALRSGRGSTWKGAEELVLEYFRQGVACPFLEDSMCSIYENRPIACREYLATSDPANCSSPTADGVRLVELPVKTSIPLKKIAIGEASRREGIFLLLISALEIAEKYPERFPEKTGEQWMADFFGRLTADEKPTEPPEMTVKSLRKKRKRHAAKR
jgi:Fe-S-cluster containining protein